MLSDEQKFKSKMYLSTTKIDPKSEKTTSRNGNKVKKTAIFPKIDL